MVNRGAAWFQGSSGMIRSIVLSRRAEHACVALDFHQAGPQVCCHLSVSSLCHGCGGSRGHWELQT